MATATQDVASSKYAPVASIFWAEPDGEPGVKVLTKPVKLSDDLEEARSIAVESTKLWIDERLKLLDEK